MTEREVSSERVKPLEWVEGVPPKPWADEWFIAQTTFNDRVVLRSLPEEYTYDFKTADDTYIKADKIKRWMQFPDSHFIAPPALRSSVKMVRVKKLEWSNGIPGRMFADIYMLERLHLDDWRLMLRANEHGNWPKFIAGPFTLDEAKAAAQADYEHRILSTLEAPSAPSEVTEEMVEADRARLVHILVVHFDMFRARAEEIASLFLHDKSLTAALKGDRP